MISSGLLLWKFTDLGQLSGNCLQFRQNAMKTNLMFLFMWWQHIIDVILLLATFCWQNSVIDNSCVWTQWTVPWSKCEICKSNLCNVAYYGTVTLDPCWLCNKLASALSWRWAARTAARTAAARATTRRKRRKKRVRTRRYLFELSLRVQFQ